MRSLLTIGLLLVSSLAFGQFNPDAKKVVDTDIQPHEVIHWTTTSANMDPSGNISVPLQLTTTRGFTLYVDKVTFKGPAGSKLIQMKAPAVTTLKDPLTEKDVSVYKAGEFALTFSTIGVVGEHFKLSIRYLGCTESICLFPYTETFDLPVYKTATPATTETVTTPTQPEVSADALQSDFAAGVAEGKYPIYLLFIIVFLGGILTNLTPCVFPMIPITVRILSGQGDSAFKSSVYYASGILITYTALGTFAALSGSMFGSVSQSIAFNTTFAVIMAVLGLSMLGFGNFAKLQNLGNKIGNGKKSPFNTFMMGTGAGLVAAPCTGPILGALLAYSTKNGNLFESCLLMFTYSFGFSLPYVFLGGTAAKISNIKVSPKVQIGTKILFASVMFSLSLYYLRIPLYEQLIQLKPYWTTTAQVMTSIGLVLSLIWLTVERLQHSKYLMIIPCAVLAVGVFSISQWATSSEHSSELAHYLTQEEGYAAAAKQNKPMLIDLWAEWCEACKKMDATTFMDPRVIKELSDNWILLKLDLTQDNDINDAIQEKYEIPGLPTLVLLPQQGKLGEKKLLIGYQTVDKLLEKLENYKKKIISL